MSGPSCIIGYATQASSPTEGTWRDTRIGGYPLWPPSFSFSAEVPACPLCNAQRVLVLQAFAPHRAHPLRIIYVFACNSLRCSQDTRSWLAMRVYKRNSDHCMGGATSRLSPAVTDSLRDWTPQWDSAEEDDSKTDSTESMGDDDIEGLLALNELTIRNYSVRESARNQPERGSLGGAPCASGGTELAAQPGALPCDEHKAVERATDTQAPPGACLMAHFIEVEQEPNNVHSASKDEQEVARLLRKYEEEEAQQLAGGDVTNWDAENDVEETESSKTAHAFQQRIARAPEQVIRYELGGSPLWPNHPPPPDDVDHCSECGSRNVFELQLLASCLYYLKPEQIVPDSQQEAAMNFAVMALYTCELDCNPTLGTEETEFSWQPMIVRVQSDEW